MADLYSVLGVARNSGEKEIKAAFRKLAKQYHPDTNPNNKEAQNKFAKISQAYEILGDKQKKAQYDRGEINEEGKPIFQGFNPNANYSRAYESQNSANFSNMNFDMGDIFRDFLGGQARNFTARDTGRTIKQDLYVSLEDVLHNSKIDLSLQSGKKLKIQLPKYVEEGQTIRLRGQANPGDVLLTIKFKNHPNFEVKNGDLYMDQSIDLALAVRGGKVNVQTLENKLAITIPPWTDSGKLFRLKAKGLPLKNGGRGDLYVRTQIALDSAYKNQLKELFN